MTDAQDVRDELKRLHARGYKDQTATPIDPVLVARFIVDYGLDESVADDLVSQPSMAAAYERAIELAAQKP